MSNYLNWNLNPWAAFAADKAKSYVIGARTQPDPRAEQPPADPLTGFLSAPVKLITTFKVDCIAGEVTTHLGEFSTLALAQAAAQADANK